MSISSCAENIVVEDQPSWKIEHTLDHWKLTVINPGDYSLLTDFELEHPHWGRYLGTIGTPEMVRHIIDKPEESVPFWISDLILVDSLNEKTLLAALRALIDQGDVVRALDSAPAEPEEDVPSGRRGRRVEDG